MQTLFLPYAVRYLRHDVHCSRIMDFSVSQLHLANRLIGNDPTFAMLSFPTKENEKHDDQNCSCCLCRERLRKRKLEYNTLCWGCEYYLPSGSYNVYCIECSAIASLKGVCAFCDRPLIHGNCLALDKVC